MHERADHTGYIRATVEHTEQQGLVVERARSGLDDGLRWARLELDPSTTPRLRLDQDHIAIVWDEEHGWGWAAVTDDHTGPILRQGEQVAPAPATVAEWIFAAMHIPHHTRADEPVRRRTEACPDLERDLVDFA